MSEAPIAKDDAAVKIQAAYRGYRERKTLSHVRSQATRQQLTHRINRLIDSIETFHLLDFYSNDTH